MPKHLEDHIREQYSRLTILRPIIDDVDLERAAIVTFSRTLREALDFYEAKIRAASSPPHFILADWRGNWAAMEHSAVTRRVRILPINDPTLCDGRPLCIYTSPAPARGYWKPFHFAHMVWLLRGMGIAACGLDAAAVRGVPRHQAPPGFLEEHIAEICEIHAGLADEESRETWLRVIKARVTGDPGWLPLAGYGEYQHPLVSPALNDVVCDGGLMEGYSAARHALRVGPGGQVYAFDPEPTNHSVSRWNLRCLPNVTVEHLGLWDSGASLHIENDLSSSTMREQASATSRECRAVALDDYLAGHGGRCDVLSLDVENAEMQALRGAAHTIRRYLPKLQISIYHSDEQLLQVPLMLMREYPGYSFYMGHHAPLHFETVLYATARAPSSEHSRILFSRTFAGTAWKRAQPTAEAEIRKTAELLYGREVVFWGAGAAYEHYKHLFYRSVPRAVVLDEQFMRGAAHKDGIPLRTFGQLDEGVRELPVVVFTRIAHAHAVMNSIRQQYGAPENIPELHPCILFDS